MCPAEATNRGSEDRKQVPPLEEAWLQVPPGGKQSGLQLELEELFPRSSWGRWLGEVRAVPSVHLLGGDAGCVQRLPEVPTDMQQALRELPRNMYTSLKVRNYYHTYYSFLYANLHPAYGTKWLFMPGQPEDQGKLFRVLALGDRHLNHVKGESSASFCDNSRYRVFQLSELPAVCEKLGVESSERVKLLWGI